MKAADEVGRFRSCGHESLKAEHDNGQHHGLAGQAPDEANGAGHASGGIGRAGDVERLRGCAGLRVRGRGSEWAVALVAVRHGCETRGLGEGLGKSCGSTRRARGNPFSAMQALCLPAQPRPETPAFAGGFGFRAVVG